MIIECAICGTEKNIRPAKVKAANYCSHACYWESKKRQTLKNCHVCDKEISVRNIWLQDKNFCSIKCRSIHFTGENHQNWKKVEPRFCKCGKEISHRLATRDRVRHCSFKCAHSGSSHYAWKGGIWVYTSDFEKRIRYEIRERDEHKCVKCGAVKSGKRDLHVHHIDGNKKNNDYKNLVTLCAGCHRREHSFLAMKVKEEKSQQSL